MSLAADLEFLALLERGTPKTFNTGVLGVLKVPPSRECQNPSPSPEDWACAADALRRVEAALAPVDDEAELTIRGEPLP